MMVSITTAMGFLIPIFVTMSCPIYPVMDLKSHMIPILVLLPYTSSLGFSLSSLGDVSGDGIVDFAIAARFSDDGGGTNSGTSFVFFWSQLRVI